MEKEEELENQEGPKPRATISFDTPGHEFEYVIDIEGFGVDNLIPISFSAKVQENLGKDWQVANRGTRLEIISRQFGRRDDEAIRYALSDVCEVEL